jgi:hypothetical protein
MAVLAPPFYAAWNWIAFVREQDGWAAKIKSAFAGFITWLVATAIWALPWLAIGWLGVMLIDYF